MMPDDWIPVIQHLPTFTEDRTLFVLVYSETHDWQGSRFAVMRQVDFYAHNFPILGTDDSQVVTHWQPLIFP